MTKPKIGLDISPLQSGHQTRGIGFYTKNLIQELKKSSEIELVEITQPSDMAKVDLIHQPFFDLFQVTLVKDKVRPVVVTIHDVTPLVFPQAYPPGWRGSWNLNRQKRALSSVAGVVTDSVASKADIEKYLKVESSKIWSIPLAPAERFQPISDQTKLAAVRKKYQLPEQFAIYTGNVNWNKNIVNMAAACLAIGLDLVLIGSGFDQTKVSQHAELREYRRFLELYGNHPQIKRIGFVEDNELVEILNLATLSLFATRYEGFGLPILEAQACGVPVVTSNLSSMPEVAGDAAILVDPNQVESISSGMKQIIDDLSRRRKLIAAGLRNVQRFSWAKTSQETIAVYLKVLKDRS